MVEEENENDPCNKLKEKAENAVFMAKFNDLNRNQVFNRDHETAYFESKNNNQIVYTYFQGKSETNQSFGPVESYAAMHVHNNDCYVTDSEGNGYMIFPVKMLSPGDLSGLISFQYTALQNNISILDTYNIMISNNGIYAIKPLRTDVNLPRFNKIQEDKDFLLAATIIRNNSQLNQNQKRIELQKYFLRFLKRVGFENKVGLFECTVTPSQTGNKLNWSRLTIENDNIIKTPC